MSCKVFALLVIFTLTLATLIGTQPTSMARAQSGSPPGGAGAQRPVTDDDVNRVAKQLYCPVCPNTPLDVCETKACADWRAQIREQLASGWTDQQVIDYFKAQYGERVLAEPARQGFTSLVWLLPAIAIVLGLVVVWYLLRSWRRPAPVAAQAPPVSPEVDPAALARIENELRELR